MRALQVTAWKSGPEFREVPDPDPGPGQVVVRVAAAGACHSDLHLTHNFDPGLLPYSLPFTLGHENTGIVETAATAVPGVWVAGNVADPTETVIGAAAAGFRLAHAINLSLITEATEAAVAARRSPLSAR